MAFGSENQRLDFQNRIYQCKNCMTKLPSRYKNNAYGTKKLCNAKFKKQWQSWANKFRRRQRKRHCFTNRTAKTCKTAKSFCRLQTASPKHCLSDILYAILQNHATPAKIWHHGYALLRKMQRFCNGKFFEKQTKMRQKLPLPTFLRHFFEQIAQLKSISLALQNILC